MPNQVVVMGMNDFYTARCPCGWRARASTRVEANTIGEQHYLECPDRDDNATAEAMVQASGQADIDDKIALEAQQAAEEAALAAAEAAAQSAAAEAAAEAAAAEEREAAAAPAAAKSEPQMSAAAEARIAAAEARATAAKATAEADAAEARAVAADARAAADVAELRATTAEAALAAESDGRIDAEARAMAEAEARVALEASLEVAVCDAVDQTTLAPCGGEVVRRIFVGAMTATDQASNLEAWVSGGTFRMRRLCAEHSDDLVSRGIIEPLS